MRDSLGTWFRAGLIIAFQAGFKVLAVVIGFAIDVKRRLFDR
jgi:hypothetical protein